MIPNTEQYDIARGSSDIPLTTEGRGCICKDGCDLAHLSGGDGVGRVSRIYTSNLQRTRDSGEILRGCLGGCTPVEHNSNLDPWYQGWIEGQVVTPTVLAEMQRYQVDAPDDTPPGRGPISTHPGEPFNNYKQRFLKTMIPIMEHYKESLLTPTPDRVVIVNHFRGIKVLQAWTAQGTPPDMRLDNKELLAHDGAPGDIHRLYIDSTGKWRIDEFDSTAWDVLPPGIYVIRHGKTPWNKESSGGH